MGLGNYVEVMFEFLGLRPRNSELVLGRKIFTTSLRLPSLPGPSPGFKKIEKVRVAGGFRTRAQPGPNPQHTKTEPTAPNWPKFKKILENFSNLRLRTLAEVFCILLDVLTVFATKKKNDRLKILSNKCFLLIFVLRPTI